MIEIGEDIEKDLAYIDSLKFDAPPRPSALSRLWSGLTEKVCATKNKLRRMLPGCLNCMGTGWTTQWYPYYWTTLCSECGGNGGANKDAQVAAYQYFVDKLNEKRRHEDVRWYLDRKERNELDQLTMQVEAVASDMIMQLRTGRYSPRGRDTPKKVLAWDTQLREHYEKAMAILSAAYKERTINLTCAQ